MYAIQRSKSAIKLDLDAADEVDSANLGVVEATEQNAHFYCAAHYLILSPDQGDAPSLHVVLNETYNSTRLFHADLAGLALKGEGAAPLVLGDPQGTIWPPIPIVNPKNLSALHVASSKGYVEIVRMLLQAKADPNVLDSVSGAVLQLGRRASCTR